MSFFRYDLLVVGGGAAGFFGAIQAAEINPGLKVLILEKSTKLLSKVKVSGGGRCNVTHHCFQPVSLAHHYPRGEKQLKEMFRVYHARHVVEWFDGKGVKLKAEEDGRMFPITNSSQTIIDCFMEAAQLLKIKIEMSTGVVAARKEGDSFLVECEGDRKFSAKNILVAIGGHANPNAYSWIEKLGHSIIPPIPSLFTFNETEKNFKDLMGLSVPKAAVKIAGTKYNEEGPLLITHWGLSGPAIITLSAWAATYLHEKKYEFTALVSWIGQVKEEDLRLQLEFHKKSRGKQKVVSNPLFNLPQRLWQRLCERSEVEEHKIWMELPQRNVNKLVEMLIRCPFVIKGKTTFKEEFVTCGGVDLNEIDITTLESKKVPNLFFAGEVLNIDGETGGFNFQAAWTTAYIAAKSIKVDKM